MRIIYFNKIKWSGVFFKEADKALIKDLKSRGLMFKSLQFEHSYPHCWRCHTALMYYAQPSWYIKTTAIKKELLRENSNTLLASGDN